MRFICVTKDWSVEGFALMLKAEGHDVIVGYENDEIVEEDKEEQDAFNLVGEGLLKCYPMKQVFESRASYRDAYWIFDSNHLWEYAEKLTKKGFKVWGASEMTHQLEHDRNLGVQVAEQAGLDIPETKEFSSVDEAITFLEQNEERAFVCKPNDDESHLTYVPQSETYEAANRELRAYLKSMDDGSEFILQEKIKGVELDCECFFFKGVPYFAWVDLECKRKNSGDKGELTGASQNISFIVDLNSELVKRTIAKMFPFYQERRYTGFGDLNMILSDNKVYFIEWTCRFGFNSHATLFKTLLIAPFGETLAAMIDGGVEHFQQRFRKGFGSSILLYIDHQQMGFPIYVSKDVAPKFYAYELYQDESVEDKSQDFYLAGYSNEVGVICGYGFTPKDSAKDALDNALKINYPSCAYREDLNETDFPSSPIKRYEALQALNVL